jgi:RHS repeat-associated protein
MVQINNDFQKALMTPVTIASFDPTYDSESNITEEDMNLDSASQTRYYAYDDENQLLTADTPNVDYTYTYDQRNNRLTQRIVSTSPSLDTTDYYTYNKEDELTAWERRTTQGQTVLEAYTFVYNELGDCVSQTKTSVSPNEVTEYEYFVGGNLKQVTLPDATEVEYLYDANSNRIQKTNATEIIDYHYSGSELKSEVHKNKQNTVLYTLTYYPYGFEKTVGQTTTSYYYIYDNRGFVWALTDSGGDIVESYDYSPYGELLSTPSITNHLFLSGADQCIYDEEVSMVHLNNRYYIPKIGRFLQRDSVEGSPAATISQNLYTYCQNSPITLIDPSGNSPQNTGTPPRVSSFDASAFSGDKSCYMPDINQPAGALASGPLIEVDIDDLPNGGRSIMLEDPESAVTEFDACNYVRELPDGTYVVVSNGVKVYVTVEKDSNGNIHLVAKPSSDQNDSKGNYAAEKILADGLNEGFADIEKRGGNLKDFDIGTMLRDVVSYSKKNLKTFRSIYTGTDPNESADEVFYHHAVVGAAIKQDLKNDSRYGKPNNMGDVGQFDMDFGFWTSFFVTEYEKLSGDRIKWNSSKTYDPATGETYMDPNKDKLGIVDLARVGKAIMYNEKGSYCFDPKWGPSKTGDWGLMQLNATYFPLAVANSPIFKNVRNMTNADWKKTAFPNIGGAMGMLFNWLNMYGGNTINGWTLLAGAYNTGSYGPSSDPGKEIKRLDYMERFRKHLGMNIGRK